MVNVNEELPKKPEELDPTELVQLYTDCVQHIAKNGEGGYVGTNRTLLASELIDRLENKK